MIKMYEMAQVCGDLVVDDFIAQYKVMMPQSAAEYNKKRAGGSPTWVTVARMCGLSKWYDLLDYCGLESPKRVYFTGRKGPKKEYIVHRYSDYEEYMKYLDSQEYWNSLEGRINYRSRVTDLPSTR